MVLPFYKEFPIASAPRTQFTWTHYKLLLRLNTDGKREYYIAETEKNNLNSRQLERQINSQLYDRTQKLPDENPTIGILLAADKNDAVVKFSLPESNSTILASQYKLYLPSEEALKQELFKEISEFEERKGEI